MSAYDVILDGLVEKMPYPCLHNASLCMTCCHRFREELRAIDVPSLVLLLQEARQVLVDQVPFDPEDDLIARIDTHLDPQPSTSPADV